MRRLLFLFVSILSFLAVWAQGPNNTGTYYQTADGNISEGTVINLKHVNFGGLELTDVKASVVKSQKAPLLLGQSVFGRLGKIEIDNDPANVGNLENVTLTIME